jgi:hypothetical protein
MRADPSRQMEKTTNQHAHIPHIGKAGTRYRISAKLGHALVAHPHNPQLAKPCQFFSKKEGLLFL